MPQDADFDSIRKAYRELAKKHHPDKGQRKAKNSGEVFLDIKEAYDCLSDPARKNEYDNKYSQLFFSDNKTQTSQGKRGADRKLAVDITISESRNGGTKNISFHRYVYCQTCGGHGNASAGKNKQVCNACEGTGTRLLAGFAMTCSTCLGDGVVASRQASKCKDCLGLRRLLVDDQVTIEIPPGCQKGDQIGIIPQKGDVSFAPDQPAGNLVIFVDKILLPKHFMLLGNNLVYELVLSVPDLVLGIKISIPLLDANEELLVHIPPGTQPGSIYEIIGGGIKKTDQYLPGSQLILINAYIPENLSEKEKQKASQWRKHANLSVVPSSRKVGGLFRAIHHLFLGKK